MRENKSTTEIFDSLASRYDTAERIRMSKIIATEIRKHIETYITPTHTTSNKETTAIDYGCGTGLVGLGLAELFESITFVDVSEKMIAQVQSKIRAMPNTGALCADLTAQVPPKLRADVVITAQTLLHIKDTSLILSRLYDVLNKEGHLFIVDFDKNEHIVSDKVHNGFEQSKLIDAVCAAGFVRAESKTFYHGNKIFMGKDASLFILVAQK
jgi:ubiquinone/menaquinone biosynthesis C-methylase UbiE